MAENKDIGFNIEVKGVESSINSIKDLKKAIKDATDEQVRAAEKFGIGSKEYQKASQNVSELKDKVDDLKDSTKSLQGSGIERASAGFSQLGEGIRNLDFDKVKVGFSAMKTAMAAVGIGLIVQLVQYLIENFEELSKGSNGVAKALRFVGDIIGEILKVGEQMLNFLTDAIGLTSELERTQEAMGKKAIDSFTKSKEALGEQTAEMDRNIKVAKAMGKNTVEMEIEKQKAIIETNKQYLLQLQQMSKTRAITEEERKLVKEAAKAIKDANAEIQIIEANANKEKEEKSKAAYEKRKAILDKEKADNEKANADSIKYIEEQSKALLAAKERERLALEEQRLQELALEDTLNKKRQDDRLKLAELTALENKDSLDAQIALLEAKRKTELENVELTNIDRALINQRYLEQEEALKKAARQKEIEEERKKQEEILQITNTGLSAAQNLSDLFFTIKTRNLKKGSKEEEEYAKKQFEINKGLQIATALVNGAQGVLAITTVPDFTLGVATAIRIAGQVALTAATVAKIATTKFQPTSSGGGGDAGGGIPSVPIPAPPTVNTPGANVEGTRFDQEGNKINNQQTPTIQVNATVGVDEISSKQNRVQVLENQSKF